MYWDNINNILWWLWVCNIGIQKKWNCIDMVTPDTVPREANHEPTWIHIIRNINAPYNSSSGKEPTNNGLQRHLKCTRVYAQIIIWPPKGSASQLWNLLSGLDSYTEAIVTLVTKNHSITQCYCRLYVQGISHIRQITHINTNNNPKKKAPIRLTT